MEKMTENTFSILFEYGKKVYRQELSTDVAAKMVNESNPEVAVSSAKHYITWYSKMKTGEFLTWNTNSKLLLYYVNRIIKEDGIEAGGIAIESAKKYAQHAGRDDLLNILSEDILIDFDSHGLKRRPSVLSNQANHISNAHQTGVFDSWQIIDEVTAKKTCDKSFFDHNGSGVPKSICWFFGAEGFEQGESRALEIDYNGLEYQGRIASESSDSRRVRIFWESRLGHILTEYRDKKDITAMFVKTEANRYSLKLVSGTSTRDAIARIKDYISSRGFSYQNNLVENFYLCLKSKPFLILAGTSGTGKTRLVKLFAEAIGAEYQLVPVRPDWSDGSDLFGHCDLNGNFIDGPVCQCFKLAYERPDKPIFLCLDEMNLARVEYYLSDFLSVIESREKLPDGTIQTSSIAQYKDGIPSNLYIVGTVNMDETTFPFSKKVLDRANTIEFSYVDLLPDFDSVQHDLEPLELPNDFLKTRYLVLTRDCSDQKDFVEVICFELQKINEILAKANAQIGYRVRDEIAFYILNNDVEGDLISFSQALDNEIMQKILPRIQGSTAMIEDMMIDLFKFCMGDLSGIDKDSGTAGEQMLSLAESAKYPKSAKKIGYMMTRYEEDGFTSYWL